MDKERLRNYRALKREKEQLEQQLETIEAALYHPKIQQIKHTPGAPSPGNAGEELAVKHLDLLERYRAKLVEITMEQLAIEEAIEKLPYRERTLIRLYYIKGLTWDRVCDEMRYSWSQVHRIHRAALELLEGPGSE